MAAILGLDGAPFEACSEAAQGQILAPVNFNSPGQVVIAGNRAAVGRGIAACTARGAKARDPVAGQRAHRTVR